MRTVSVVRKAFGLAAEHAHGVAACDVVPVMHCTMALVTDREARAVEKTGEIPDVPLERRHRVMFATFTLN